MAKKYYDNEMRYQEKIMEQYSTENLFKRERKTTVSSENINITSVPQKYEEPKWYDKILEFIKKLFNIE